MSLLIDSAIISEVAEASKWGWISGVTTNPTLLAKSEYSPEDTLRRLADLISGQIYYQLTAKTEASMLKEAEVAHKILGDQLVLKIPATENGFKIVSTLSSDIPCAVTALFSSSQAMVAEAAGAQNIIIYYNRSIRLMNDGLNFIQESIAVLKGTNTGTIAASLKSTEEIVAAKLAGINHLTIPYSLLKKIPYAELSESAIKDFDNTGTGLNISQ